MKIGYKIIIGSALIFFVSKPAHSVLERYKFFKEKQNIETTALLHSFKTRPADFFKNPNYEGTVKSFIEKNIKNVDLDLSTKDEPLAIIPVVASTETAIITDNAVVTEQSINTDTENAKLIAEAEKVKADELEKQKELEKLKEVEKQKELKDLKEAEKLKEIEKLKDIEKAKKMVKAQELEQKKELEKKKAQELQQKKELEKKKAQELAAKAKVEEFQYFVQLGVFGSIENANILLKQAGTGFIVVKSTVNDKQYIVRSRPGKKADMEALSAKAKNLGLTPIVRIW